MRTYVIAEAASAHDGELAKALRLVQLAASHQADAVKFQFWSDADALADKRGSPEAGRAAYRTYALPVRWLPQLALAAQTNSLNFMCSTFLPADVATVAPFVSQFKVASAEATDRELLAAHQGYDKAVVVSVPPGMETKAKQAAQGLGLDIVWLHCIPSYPAPLDGLGLRRLRSFAGFSDHSGDTLTGGVAVAAGASIVEVHLKLYDTAKANPDAGAFALSATDFGRYVRFVRKVELMLGAEVAA